MKKTYRKWGYYQVLGSGKVCGLQWKMKKLVLFPNGQTSLQKHNFRSEFWIDDVGGTHIIDIGRCHQIKNSTKKNRTIVELQWGKSCLESDIERKPNE